MIIAETSRLRIRHLTAADAAFTCKLLNEPSFIENIADRGVRSELDALHYLADGPIKSYQQHGYGLFIVEQSAVMHFGYSSLKLKRIVGLTSAGNTSSIKLLSRLGLRFEKMVKMQPSEEYVQLYS